MSRLRVKVPTPVALALALLATAPAGLRGQSRPSLGPMVAEEGAPFQRLGYTPAVEVTPTVPVGTLRTDVWLGYANLFEQDSTADHRFYQDMERAIWAITLRYGAADGLEVGGRLTVQNAWGGFLDDYVSAFHASIGMGDRYRTTVHGRHVAAWLVDAQGDTVIDIAPRRLSLDDVRLFAKWQVADGEAGTLAVRAVAWLPTNAPRVGSVRANAGIMALGTTHLLGAYLHAMAGASTVRREEDMQDLFRDHHWFGMIGLEVPFWAHMSAVAEITGSTQILRDRGDYNLDLPPTNAILGVVGVTESGWRWEVGMQEDFPAYGPSLDFTLQFALGRRW